MTDSPLHFSHFERHFVSGAVVRDLVIGLADGLTVPFALAAGLSGAVVGTRIVVTAGLAEIAAGSIAMGLGGYLASRGEGEHYAAELAREQREIIEFPEIERAEVREVFQNFGLEPDLAAQATEALSQNPEKWVEFMMRFELGLEEPDPSRAYKSAATIAGAYIAGGMFPLAPYMIWTDSRFALQVSIGLTLAALTAFGYAKGKFTGTDAIKSAWQTALVGGAAAGAAFFIARSFN